MGQEKKERRGPDPEIDKLMQFIYKSDAFKLENVAKTFHEAGERARKYLAEQRRAEIEKTFERFQKSLDSEKIIIPSGLTPEEIREFILSHAEK